MISMARMEYERAALEIIKKKRGQRSLEELAKMHGVSTAGKTDLQVRQEILEKVLAKQREAKERKAKSA